MEKNIRICEYYEVMPDSLRQFKAGTFSDRLSLEQANLSQHLAVLRSRQIVVTRKSGNQVFYSVRDPLIHKMLDLLRRYFQKQVGESMALLENIEKAEERR
jgi:ArsR family transcriptional regulator